MGADPSATKRRLPLAREPEPARHIEQERGLGDVTIPLESLEVERSGGRVKLRALGNAAFSGRLARATDEADGFEDVALGAGHETLAASRSMRRHR
jgi:hypothetical protein